MAVIVNSGSTVIVTPSQGLTLTADSTIEAGGILQGAGTVSGLFDLRNLGQITGLSGGLAIDTGTFDNRGSVEATVGGNVTIGPSVNLLDESNGTLYGTWNSFGGVISLSGSQITVDNADINLSNSGTLTAGSTSVLNSLTQIGTFSTLTLDSMSDVFLSQPFTDSGVLSEISTDLSVASLTVTSGGVLNLQGGVLAGSLTLNGTMEIYAAAPEANLPGSIAGSGTILVRNGAVMAFTGSTTLSQTLINDGYVLIQNSGPGEGVTIASSASGAGTIEFTAGTLELDDSPSTNVSFNYSVDPATIVLGDPAASTAWILGMGNTVDAVVLNGIIGDTATLSGQTLSVISGTGTVATLNLEPLPSIPFEFAGQVYSNAVFKATPNVTENNTTITVSGVTAPPVGCFRSGTWIATASGPVPVERLVAEDSVLTCTGGVRRVIWTGHRTIDFRDDPRPSRLWPIRISPDSFGPAQPRRDLFLSPDHAVFLEGMLIPIRYLINDTTIRQVAIDRITYHHIELEEHDIMLAEGLAVESYLDHGDRGFFAGGDASVGWCPDLGIGIWEMMACAPLVVTGAGLVQARAMLEKRANSAMFARHAEHA